MLWLTHTLSKSSSMATLARSLACPDRIWTQIVTEKVVWPCSTIPFWLHHWPILVMSYLVVHHHWINARNILWEIHLWFHFRSAYLFAFLLVLLYSMVHVCFSTLLQASLLALTSFGSLALWLIWMVPFHFKDHKIILTLFTFEILKQYNQKIVVAIDNACF